MQLENPVDTVFYAAGIAQSAGVPYYSIRPPPNHYRTNYCR